MIYKYSLETGQILACIRAPLSDIEHYPAEENEAIFISDVYCPEGYVENGGLFPLPESPAPHHEWDWTTKSWIPDLPAAIAARKAEIDVDRDRRINLPLAYDGKNLDADARARENLKSKLEEIKSREALNQPMPQSMMVWRDADNVTHSWPTQVAYKTWLEGFAVTMSERGTLIYGACWAHKSNVEALPGVEAVAAYDIAQGWPG